MSGLVSVLSVSAGTLLAIVLFVTLVFWYVKDITQKKHTVLRNYPIIGRLRYFFEQMGEYFRQYFFTGERDEMPFNRSTRGWVYRLAKNEGGMIGFGSTYNLHEPGALVFVNAPFPVIEAEQLPTPPLTIGEGYCDKPFVARSIGLDNARSAMVFGGLMGTTSGVAGGLAATDPRLVPYGAMTATFYTGLGCLLGPSLIFFAIRAIAG